MFAGYEAVRALLVSITKERGGGGAEEETAAKTNARRMEVNHPIAIEKFSADKEELWTAQVERS